eukprot:8228-Chlamydomonas_euryale.AAC.1
MGGGRGDGASFFWFGVHVKSRLGLRHDGRVVVAGDVGRFTLGAFEPKETAFEPKETARSRSATR